MAANTLTFNQIATIMATAASMATGKNMAIPTTTADFVTLGTTLNQIGTEGITKAITTLLGETIFSVRPYEAQFSILTREKSKYIAHARKINYGDNGFEDDIAFDTDALVDGVSVDPWTIRKNKCVQTNFYGQNVVSDHITIFEDQYDFSFSDAAQWGQFITGVTQNIDDKFTQAFENTSRLCMVNFIGSVITKIGGNASPRIFKMFTEYAAETGITLTTATYRDPQYFGDFAKWAISKIKVVSDYLKNRNVIFHDNFTNIDIPRHTPYARQKGIFYSPILKHMDTNVLSAAFNDKYLKFEHEEIPFWQSLAEPDTINVTPNYIDNDGVIQTANNAVNITNLFGVIFDDEAMGHTIFDTKVRSTSLNPKGLYYNTFFHYRSSWWNDTTEDAVIFVLD